MSRSAISRSSDRRVSVTISLIEIRRRSGLAGRIARKNWLIIRSNRAISSRATPRSLRKRSALPAGRLRQFPFHELQMDVQGIERVADFMSHAGRQQRQRGQFLRFDGGLGLFARLGHIAQNHGHAR